MSAVLSFKCVQPLGIKAAAAFPHVVGVLRDQLHPISDQALLKRNDDKAHHGRSLLPALYSALSIAWLVGIRSPTPIGAKAAAILAD